MNDINFSNAIKELKIANELHNNIPPIIPDNVLYAIGLTKSIITGKILTYYQVEELLKLFSEYEHLCFEYAKNIILNYPNLDDNAKNIINNTTKEWIEYIYPYKNALENYKIKFNENIILKE